MRQSVVHPKEQLGGGVHGTRWIVWAAQKNDVRCGVRWDVARQGQKVIGGGGVHIYNFFVFEEAGVTIHRVYGVWHKHGVKVKEFKEMIKRIFCTIGHKNFLG